MTLQEWHADNPGLLRFFEKKLLEPEWAGELDDTALAYIKSCLRESPSLKRKWGFRPSARRFSESRIRTVARDGLWAIKGAVLHSAAKAKTA
jgi:hypothetical protein